MSRIPFQPSFGHRLPMGAEHPHFQNGFDRRAIGYEPSLQGFRSVVPLTSP